MARSIVLGGGCFWCLDAAYRAVTGITSCVSGYAGGSVPNPTYEQVSTGATGHAEVVRLTYDEHITLEDILKVFWTIHDPTTPNRQGHDIGTQYRSCIYYENADDATVIQQSIENTQKLWSQPIVTEVKQLDAFYPAEEYHQNYFAKNPEAGYCQAVINPKLQKLHQQAAELLV